MAFSDYRTAAKRERVIIALSMVLRSLDAPASTIDVCGQVMTLVDGTRQDLPAIGRILTSLAPSIPEAVRGETFTSWGRQMQRWVWWPKGTSPSGATRQARRAPVLTDAERLRVMPRETVADLQAWNAALEAVTGKKIAPDEDEPFENEPWSA